MAWTIDPGARHSLRIGIVGPGRLGTALTAALAGARYTRVRVASRDPVAAAALAEQLPEVEAIALGVVGGECDLVMLTVPDGAIAGLAGTLGLRDGQAVVHSSGAHGLELLGVAAAAGAAVGQFHPLQTFPPSESMVLAATRFAGISCGIEAAAPLDALLEGMAVDLGASVLRLESVARAPYHAAAVLVSNDVVALMAAATRVWTLAGLPAESARVALSPLLSAAGENIRALPLERALTGPIARGDVDTVRRHLAALAALPDLRDLYRQLALELLTLDLGHDATTTAALRDALGAGDAA